MIDFDGRIGHLEGIESPWANAGGVAKTLEENLSLAQTGIGWIEDGSQTADGRLGNAVDPEHPELGPTRKVYTHNAETGETGNSLGMPGNPIDIWASEIPEKVQIAETHGKAFVQNVAPVSNNPTSESMRLVERAYREGAHAVILNGGCPNIFSEDGGRHEILSRNPEEFYVVLAGLRQIVDRYHPIFVRISPQATRNAMKSIMEVVIASGVVSAVFTPNTWPGYVPKDKHGNPILEVPGGAGGLSGPAVAHDADVQTRWAAEYLSGTKIDVVSSAGITTAAELKKRLRFGNVVAGAGTTFFYESKNGWADETSKLLHDLAG